MKYLRILLLSVAVLLPGCFTTIGAGAGALTADSHNQHHHDDHRSVASDAVVGAVLGLVIDVVIVSSSVVSGLRSGEIGRTSDKL